jgi:hypothetical protein
VGTYRHPRWLVAAGLVVAMAMAALGAWTLVREVPKVWG